MPSRKRTVEIEVVVDDKQAQKNLKNIDKATGQTATAVQRTAKTFSDAGKVIAGIAIFDKVKDFGQQVMNQYVDLNESINAVNVTFGKSAEGIKQLGEAAATSVGLSNAEFNQLAVGFSAFVDKIAQSAGGDTVAILDTLTTRIADFASVMNLEVAEASEKFRAGLAGETEPLRQFGIDVSAAAVNAKALELGLAGSSKELTEQDKILARYELIMEQTEKTAGDFQNTSGELANQQRILNAEWKNAQAAIGEQVAPALLEGTDAATDLLTVLDALVGVVPGVESTGDAMGRAFNMAFLGIPALLDGLADLVDGSDESAVSMQDVVKAFGTGRDALHNFAGDLGPTTEQIEIQEETLRAQAAAQEEAARKADAHREALRRQRETLREIHNPLFRAVRLNEDLAEAEDDVAKAQKKGVGSDDYRNAVMRRAELIADLTDTVLDLKKDGIDPTGAAARQMLTDMGIPQNVIDDIFEDIRAIEERIESSNPRMTVDMFMDTSNLPSNIDPTGGNLQFHQGGVVPGTPGSDVPVMAQAGEEVIRRSDAVGHRGSRIEQTVNLFDVGSNTIEELAELARRQ